MSSGIVSLLLGAGWLVAILFGMAILGMTYHVGNLYAYTGAGVSRMGPRLGDSLTRTPFAHEGRDRLLGELLSKNLSTLLVFANYSPEEGLVKDTLRFAKVSRGEVATVVLSLGPLGKWRTTSEESGDLRVFALEGTGLQTKLGVRVLPYGLLVNPNGILVGKGLVNHLPHMCFLIRSRSPLGSPFELHRTLENCRPYLAGGLQLVDSRGS